MFAIPNMDRIWKF